MAKWKGTAAVSWCFEAPDKRTAQARFERLLATVEPARYRDDELEEIEDAEFLRETDGE